jgi:AhpD family alkylhydroperoxidase
MSEYVVPQTRISLRSELPAAYTSLLTASVGMQEHIEKPLAELLKLRVSQINGCSFCVDKHSRDAKAAGEDDRRLYALAAWEESAFFTARERIAFALAESITHVAETGVPDEVWEPAQKEFTSAELASVVGIVALMNALNRVGVTSRLVPADR